MALTKITPPIPGQNPSLKHKQPDIYLTLPVNPDLTEEKPLQMRLRQRFMDRVCQIQASYHHHLWMIGCVGVHKLHGLAAPILTPRPVAILLSELLVERKRTKGKVQPDSDSK
jgi:hypothetical protein